MNEKDLTKKVLEATAKDLNQYFEPAIATGRKITNDQLKSDLISAGNELTEDDKITDESRSVLIALGIKLSSIEKITEGSPEEVTEVKEEVSEATEISKVTEVTETPIFLKKDLESAATELSTVMKFEDPIPTGRKATVATLTADIKEAALELEETDVISDETKAVMSGLGITLAGDIVEEAAQEKEILEKIKEDIVSHTENKKEEIIQPTKKSTPKISTPRTKYRRSQALADALKTGGTRQEIVVLIDGFYEKNGGTPNPKGAKAMMDIHFPILIAMKVVNIDKEGVISCV